MEVTEAIAFITALLPQPHLAAREAVRVLQSLGLVTYAGLHQGQPPDIPGATVLCLDAPGDSGHYLVFAPKSDPGSREMAAAFASIVRQGAISSTTQVEARRQVLSWDVDVAPEGTAGLYISPVMKRLLATVRRVAPGDLPVLLMGETGTGKEVLAQEIHALSRRADEPFIAVNVSAMPSEMLEGLLFGYRRGAFTGAVADAKGLIREAAGGTLFIDEIGELTPDLQPKLLRFLESGEIQPLGERPQHVDVRIVAATNARLEQLVREGRFRDDLYYRLNVVSLTIPPLRERREEIPTLINHFLTRHARAAGKAVPQITPQVLERLTSYPWPGNVRQLTNELKRIVALHDENELVDMKYLSEAIRAEEPAAQAPSSAADTTRVTIRLDQTLQEMYDDLERVAIPRAMQLEGHNQTEAARRLGITRKGLYLKRRRLGLQDEEARRK